VRRRWPYIISISIVLLILGVPHLLAQETQAQETAALDAVTRWKIINTAIFVAALGYFLWKYAPAFFNARSADIQKAIKDATGLKMEAEFRYSEIDRKMATLAEEVKKMRERAAGEMERQHERFRHETQSEITHIQHNVAAEIEAFRQQGMIQVRQRTAELALEQAEKRLRERSAFAEGDDSVEDFIHLVERGKK
jgi:F-type H+-transporting ATPase subunit b